MAIKPKKNKVTGTKKADKITWLSTKDWKKALTVNAGKGNDVIDFRKSKYKNVLNGQRGKDTIYGGSNADTIYGGSGNDKLYGYAGNDVIYGGTGADYIDGGAGNDTITGNSGNDTIYGGSGNNTYKFKIGDGKDTIINGEGNDTIKFDGKYDISYSRNYNGDDLIINYGKNDTITLQDFFVENSHSVKKISNGSTLLDLNENLMAKGYKMVEKGRNADINNFKNTNIDLIIGGAGDDTIMVGNSDDVSIYAGEGDDEIELSKLNNAIIYGGMGNDRIYVSDLNNSVIYGGDGDDGMYVNSSSDGWSNNVIFYGGAGGDRMNIEGDKCIIYGGEGNDDIRCKGWIEYLKDNRGYVYDISYHKGHHTVVFNNGDGNDAIVASSNYITLKFNNTSLSEITLEKNEDSSLYIKYNDGTDSVKLYYEDIYDDTYEALEDYFSDYTIVDKNGTAKTLEAFVAEYGAISESTATEILVTDGNGTINGSTGDDILCGGVGVDKLYGGEGNDTYEITTNLSDSKLIYDGAGETDKIILTQMDKDNIILRFDVQIDGEGNIIEAFSKNMYITSIFDFGKMEKGVNVVNQFVNGHGIEEIQTTDDYALTSAQINQLRSDVAGWLHTNGFTSVQEILSNGNQTNINNLIAEFQKANWQEMPSLDAV